MRVKSNKLALRVLSTATFLAMVSSCATAAFAGTYYMEDGSISIVAKTDGNYITQGTTINDQKDAGETVITNHNSETASKNTVTIKTEKDCTANVTLDNVNINASDTGKAALTVTGTGDTEIELSGDNTLVSGSGHAGLEKSDNTGNGTLIIKDDKNDDGTEKTEEQKKAETESGKGAGSLTATGGAGGAGIGGASSRSSSNITITGGTVTASSAAGAAGIGGGRWAGAGTADSAGVTITNGTVTANGGAGAAGIGDGANNVSDVGSVISITGGTVTANGGAGEAAGIGNGENDANDAAVNISATTARLDVTAVTQGSDEAITGGDDMTMAELNNQFSGVVRFFRGTNHYNTVHNGKYVGMDDNNADEHQETDAHIWGSTEIIRQATPTEQGILRHHCAVDGCKGYYEEFFDYVAPAEPVTPAPTDPDTPDVPGTSDSTPGTPAQGTPADAATADAVPGAATAEEVSVTPSGAQTVTAALPKTGVNWLAAVGSAISGMVLLAAGYVLDRKSRRQN